MSQFSSATDKEPLLAVSAPWVSLLGNTHLESQPIPTCWWHLELNRTCLIPTGFGTGATAAFDAQVFSGVASVSPLVLLN